VLRKDVEDEGRVNTIIKARLKSEDYGVSPDAYECADTVDLWDLADNLSEFYPNETTTLKTEIENTVIYSRNGRDKPNAKGVSIYWPARNIDGYSENYATIEDIYDGFGVSSEYMLFLNGYARFIKESDGVEFGSPDEYDDGYYDDEGGLFSALISWLFNADDESYANEYADENYEDEYYEDEYYEEDSESDGGDASNYADSNTDGYWDGYYEIEIYGQSFEVEIYIQDTSDGKYVDTLYVYSNPGFYSVGYFDNNEEWVEDYRLDVDGNEIRTNRTQANTDDVKAVATPPDSKQEADESLEQITSVLIDDKHDARAKGELEDSDDGISFYVDKESLDIIDKVYLCVGEIINNPKDRVIILGLDTDVSIDDDGKIFAEVYEGWEMLNGEFVSLIELAYDAETNMTKYGIPVKLNGVEHYIVVVYNDEFPDGQIIGARKISERGLPDKQLVKVKANDEIIPYYHYEDLNGEKGQVLGNQFVVADALVLGWKEFPAGEYVFGFEVVDIYQNRTYTDFIVYEFDVAAVPTIVMGGGVEVIKTYISKEQQIEIMSDIHANAKGYEILACAKINSLN